MAKKPYDFKKLSDVKCGNPDCRKTLKKNVVERKPQGSFILCWECWIKNTRHMSLSAYKKYRAARTKALREGEPKTALRIVVDGIVNQHGA